jgi:hypothetical protein
MMETKFFTKYTRTAKWFFSIVLMLSLFWTSDVRAQLEPPARQQPIEVDRALEFKVDRLQVQAMELTAQKFVVEHLPPYIIMDLINFRADMDINDPTFIFMSEAAFLSSSTENKLLYLSLPDKYIITAN